MRSADALTDGLLALRFLFGIRGPTLVEGVLSLQAGRIDPVAIADFLSQQLANFDIDANGATDALTDGLLMLRFLFGFRGAALTSGAVGPACSRCSPQSIEQHLESLIGSA